MPALCLPMVFSARPAYYSPPPGILIHRQGERGTMRALQAMEGELILYSILRDCCACAGRQREKACQQVLA